MLMALGNKRRPPPGYPSVRGFAIALSRLGRAIDAALLKRAGGALLTTGAVLGLAGAPRLAGADTYTVTKLADTNDGTCNADCSLREAIAAANANAGADTVIASTVTGTMTLDVLVSGFYFIRVTDALTLIGPGAGALTLDGRNASRFFSVINPKADFTVRGLTLANGHTVGHGGAIYSSANLTLDDVTILNARSDHQGGGISVRNADLILENSTVSGCFATTVGGGVMVDDGNAILIHSTVSGSFAPGDGGGILVDDGNATLTNSIVSGNYAGEYGGGFYVQFGNAMLTDSTVSGNHANGSGGGFFELGNATLANSTISDNTAGDGGGFYLTGGNATLSNSTVTGNMAVSSGGGSHVRFGNASFTNSTISFNTSGVDAGGFFVESGLYSYTVDLENSIVANNVAANGAWDEFYLVSLGTLSLTTNYVLVEGTSNPTVTGTSNITGQDPQLGPLQDNGGPTWTHALLSGSPAINTGDPAFVPPPDYDQRGVPFVRVYGDRVDMGSVEKQPAPVIFANGFE